MALAPLGRWHAMMLIADGPLVTWGVVSASVSFSCDADAWFLGAYPACSSWLHLGPFVVTKLFSRKASSFPVLTQLPPRYVPDVDYSGPLVFFLLWCLAHSLTCVCFSCLIISESSMYFSVSQTAVVTYSSFSMPPWASSRCTRCCDHIRQV